MSYRLACEGQASVAVDLLTNDQDGLGAAGHYTRSCPSLFPRFQAELDSLPFDDGQFDLAIFNSSFHYSENYGKTLAEALRCVRPGGTVVIADTPWYSDEESGQQMLDERRTRSRTSAMAFPPTRSRARNTSPINGWKPCEQQFGIRWQTH